MKEIILTKGYKTIVDDDWYYKLTNQFFRWSADLDRTTGNYYAVTKKTIDGKRNKFRMHRVIMNASKGEIVDHINRNTLDNRLENLRIVTNSQNRMNIIRKNIGTSIYKGVYWSKQYRCYIAQLRKDSKRYILGRFDNEMDAALAYNNAAEKMFGEYARLNEVK